MAVLFGVIYWASTTALHDHIDQDLALARDALITSTGPVERSVPAAVADALRGSHGEFRYLMLDADRMALTGDLPSQLAWRAGYQEVELPTNRRGSPRFEARAA